MAVAHAIMGASIVTVMRADSPMRAGKKIVLLGALLAVCPDFDVLLSWVFGLDGRWHRGFSHSLVFGIGLGLSAWAVTCAYHGKDALICVMATLSHTFSDSLFGQGRDAIELLWPFSNQRYNLGILPYMAFPLDPQNMSAGTLLKQFATHSLIELIIFAPLLVFSYFVWKRCGPRPVDPPSKS